MNKKIIDKMEQYAAALKRESVPIDHLYVFGSAAHGEQHEWSDIDVGVVGKAFASDRIEEMTQLQVIADEIDSAISPLPLRPEDMSDRFSATIQAIQKEGKEIAIQ